MICPLPPIMASETDEILTDLSPVIKVYKNGRVERLFGSPIVPPTPQDPVTGVSSKDITISPQVSARLYLPKLNHPSEKLPILVYFHGGGFCVESAFSFYQQRYLNLVVAEARVVCVSVEYRSAPEYLLPIAYEDSWTALQWVASHFAACDESNSVNLDPWLINHGDLSKIYLGGDSAGGNIVHNLCMRAGAERLKGDVKISGGLLCFPFFWGSSSEKDNELSLPAKFWNFVYPTAPGGIDSPMINPVAENGPSLSQMGCSRILVVVAEKDELKDATKMYSEALKNSGWKGKVEFFEAVDEIHCFQIFDPHTDKAKDIIKMLASFINA